jgi:hypothetical protein
MAWIKARQKLQAQYEQAQFKRSLQREKLAARRDLVHNQLLLRYQQDREIEYLRSELRQDEQRTRLIEEYQAAHNPTDAPPGRWLETTFHDNSPDAPLVLFNTHLGGDIHHIFNPLRSVCEQYNAFASRVGSGTVRSFGKRPFSADDAIAQFYYRELAPLPAILVTGASDGHAVSVQASVFGLLPNQVNWDGDQVRVSGHTQPLGRFSANDFAKLESALAKVPPEDADARALNTLATELFAVLHSLVVNTSIQMIIDHFLARSGIIDVDPLANNVFEEQLARFTNLVKTTGVAEGVQSVLGKQAELCRQCRYLEKWTSGAISLADSGGRDEDEYPPTDEYGPTLY